MKECRHCERKFNVNSTRKREVGGQIDECPSCVNELGAETIPLPADLGSMSGDEQLKRCNNLIDELRKKGIVD